MRPLAGLAACAALLVTLAAPAAASAPGTREGPFVVTDRTLTALLKDGFEIKGLMGSSMILVKAATLYSCSLAPDREALSYKPHFVCSILDEIAPDRDNMAAGQAPAQ